MREARAQERLRAVEAGDPGDMSQQPLLDVGNRLVSCGHFISCVRAWSGSGRKVFTPWTNRFDSHLMELDVSWQIYPSSVSYYLALLAGWQLFIAA